LYKAYATLTQLKSYLSNTVTTNDTDLLRYVEDASIQIDDICHRHFNVWEGVQYFDGAARVLNIDEDILSVTTIATDEDGSQTYSTTLLTADYILYPINGLPLYPKYMVKLAINASVGSFASGVLAGVKITGLFGYGNGLSTTPYADSGVVVNTGGITGSATTHALASGKGASFSAGMTIRIDTEQLYVSGVSTDTLTFVRGVNGTTAAAHLAAATIYIYSYPSPIVEACILQAGRDFKRRESPVQATVGSAEMGIVPVSKGVDPDVTDKLKRYIKRKIA
jgi:hypothetical protein